MRRLRTRPLLPVVALALCAVATGCGGSDQSAVVGGGSELFPAATLRDWVSYADHVAVFTVVGERELPADQADIEHGGGLQGREVDLQVERTLWSADGAPPLPDVIHMEALGWVIQAGGERREAVIEDGPRVEVGERYVAPLARVRAGTGELEWWPLSVGAQLPLSSGQVSEPKGRPWRSESLGQLKGTTTAQLEGLLRGRAPDPLAARYMHLRPQERVAAVNDDRARAQGLPPDDAPR